MNWSRRALTLTVILLMAGCSSSTSGRPVPQATTETNAEMTVASGPRSFNLSGVDPCLLIPSAQRLKFGLTVPEMRSKTEDETVCGLTSSTDPTVGIFLNLRKSAQDTVAPVRAKIVESVTIDGFLVPLLSNPGGSQCEGFVQTGPSQYMSVATNGYGQFPVPELCKAVQPLLKIAIDTLTTLQPS